MMSDLIRYEQSEYDGLVPISDGDWVKWEEANRLDIENERLREALDRICRPIWWMQEDQKRKTGSINGIRGSLAIARSESSEYLRGIARDALSTNEVPKAKNANNLQPEKE